MAMFAERRRKTKWTNPGRQALWKRDSGGATFGREMMEKMGWKVGQGLGANEQGIKEPLKISFKNDNKGMGFKDNDNEWIQQQSDFDEFLSKLSSEKKELPTGSQANTVQSLEERSRLSKARVHYHRFTRGKDMTKYTKKDLECILGRNEKESSEISGNMKNRNENIGNEDKNLITAGSMVDYFAKKMQSKKKKKEDSSNIMDHEIGESSLESRSKDEPEENVIESATEFDEKREKKSKKKNEKDEGGCNEAPCDEMDVDNSDYKMKPSSEGGKKSKKTKIVQEHDQSADVLDGSRSCENETADTESVEIPEKKENVNDMNLEGDEVLGEKVKKKRKKEENLVEQFDVENVEALNVLENKGEGCDGIQEKGDSLTSGEKVRTKKKTSKWDRRVIINEDDEGASKEKIKRKKKCLEAENRFNYKDCGINENDLNPVSHTETNFKKEKENGTNWESAVGNKQETREDERERIAGEDPLYYKEELLKEENSLKGTSRNKF